MGRTGKRYQHIKDSYCLENLRIGGPEKDHNCQVCLRERKGSEEWDEENDWG